MVNDGKNEKWVQYKSFPGENQEADSHRMAEIFVDKPEYKSLADFCILSSG